MPGDLPPTPVQYYLLERGWTRLISRDVPRGYAIWEQGDQAVIVPYDWAVPDYADRVETLLAALEEHEGRPQSAIRADIMDLCRCEKPACADVEEAG
jgi:hypothetical protein